MENKFYLIVARELQLSENCVQAVIKLLQDGNTVPFVARYRKEQTSGLDEVQIRDIRDRHEYVSVFHARKETILDSIKEQGKLSPKLRQKIKNCATKTALEDLYLPFKPKRRTRGAIAKERGLGRLADQLMDPTTKIDPEKLALSFVNSKKKVTDIASALQGARDIFAENVADRIEVRSVVRNAFEHNGVISTEEKKQKAEEKKDAAKFTDYYEYTEPLQKMPSHRILAIWRGEAEGILRISIKGDDEGLSAWIVDQFRPAKHPSWQKERKKAIEDAFKRIVKPSISSEIRAQLKVRADQEAVTVFADNLQDLLLAPPLIGKNTIGIDPGFRSGCKCAALDETGQFLAHITIYPHSKNKREQLLASSTLLKMIRKYKTTAIGIGNGTAGRETKNFVEKTLHDAKQKTLVVSVNEAGASVYSASEIAREEFPKLDLTIRGAISIGRRLQDPLAELVKIDPKAIGVGQYQHDVNQKLLKKTLSEVVESCVNKVGVNLNTASTSLLSYVAGIGPTLAKRIVAHRDRFGEFASRKDLLKVSGIGAKTYQQAAGFLRIPNGINPLDASAVHPEHYSVVKKMAKKLNVSLKELVGNHDLVAQIQVNSSFSMLGSMTINDILDELRKVGRDPRDTFKAIEFHEDVNDIKDLIEGMLLNGVVTNVTAFGAFVDIGVHQDGLIHISKLADRFIKEPKEVVRVGQQIKVQVLTIDLARQRISLQAHL